jgi:hypothetical protein
MIGEGRFERIFQPNIRTFRVKVPALVETKIFAKSRGKREERRYYSCLPVLICHEAHDPPAPYRPVKKWSPEPQTSVLYGAMWPASPFHVIFAKNFVSTLVSRISLCIPNLAGIFGEEQRNCDERRGRSAASPLEWGRSAPTLYLLMSLKRRWTQRTGI